jgi:hypothetical protein
LKNVEEGSAAFAITPPSLYLIDPRRAEGMRPREATFRARAYDFDCDAPQIASSTPNCGDYGESSDHFFSYYV